jgi:uncharacterized protein
MHAVIFVLLPVAHIERSRKFFTDLGYTFNEKFRDGGALALVLGENQFAMLIQTDFLDGFHPVETADASKAKECIICLSADSRDAVDALVDRAIAAGSTAGDTEDHGFMCGRSYDDPDGHTCQIFWMDPGAAEVGLVPMSTLRSSEETPARARLCWRDLRNVPTDAEIRDQLPLRFTIEAR